MASQSRWQTASEVWRFAHRHWFVVLIGFTWTALSWAHQEFPSRVPDPTIFALSSVPSFLLLLVTSLYAVWITFSWAHHTVSEVRLQTEMSPRPNIVFVRPRPAFGSMANSAGQKISAYFVRAEFENRRVSSPSTTSLTKPHVRIRYFMENAPEDDDRLFALVREGRIAESPERFDPTRGAISIAEAGMPEVRVGQSMTIDLIVRLDGEVSAHTWSNEGFGQAAFHPGKYTAVIEIEGDNVADTILSRLIINVPETINEYPSVVIPGYVERPSPLALERFGQR